MKRSRLLAAGGVPLLAAAAAVSSAVAPSAAVSAKVPNVPVTHVIEIMIENHSFDNLFGQFPGADGIPANTSLLNPNAYFDSAPNVHPVWATGNEGLVLDSAVNGAVALTLTPPPGVTAPSSFPSSVVLSGGQANITVSFPSAGYWRIGASGPGGSKGWVTVDVGVTPDTAP